MRDMGNNPWWCLTTLIPGIGLWVFLWLGFAKPRVTEAEATEGIPAEEHEDAVQPQNPSDGLADANATNTLHKMCAGIKRPANQYS